MKAMIATEYVMLDGVMEGPGREQCLGPRGSPIGIGIYEVCPWVNHCPLKQAACP